VSRVRDNSVLLFCIGVSVFGIILITMWAINPPMGSDNVSWRKPLIGSLFGLVCVLGIFAAQFPNTCSGAFHFRDAPMPGGVSRQTLIASHHPDCQRFSAHVVHIKGRMRCAACLGLFLGAIIALGGAIFYFFGGWQIESARFLPVLIGVLGVLAGFLQSRFRGYVRLTLNSLFVLGGFLCLAGIDQISQNLVIDLFLVMLIIFWILTRIQLSQWDHSRICDSCESPCRGEQTREKTKLVSAANPEEGANYYQDT
jgi:uncharacterized membrane protein